MCNKIISMIMCIKIKENGQELIDLIEDEELLSL